MLQSLPSICSGVSFPSFMTIFQSQLLLCRSRSLQPLLAFSTHSPQALYSRSCSSSCSSPLSTAGCSSSSGQMLSFRQRNSSLALQFLQSSNSSSLFFHSYSTSSISFEALSLSIHSLVPIALIICSRVAESLFLLRIRTSTTQHAFARN